ncbi:G-patch domain [Quillaja saponaria]|uniref:G-patch domain n=1 Tax=Quillaja saponaria TaxID=32244 RepID=A0AAD7PZY1_QUISA|nr:G-patch domain [Quillaja saponaria]
MTESANKRSNNGGGEEEEEDYMGDLSQFLPPEASDPPKSLSKKISNRKPLMVHSSKKQSKTLNWQERRKLERERKQQEEDEETLAKVEAPIPQSNIGFKLLKQMGYTPGSALGKEGSGIAEPVGLEIRRSRAGIGLDDPQKEKQKMEEITNEKKRKKEEALMEEFGSRQKSQWQSKRVVVNFLKAKATLAQLENREVMEPEKNEDDEESGHDEEDEEEITEEQLQDLLMILRDEYQYCLFCGYQYESVDALLENCPGTNEDDH